mgnify:CR=1 FL=1
MALWVVAEKGPDEAHLYVYGPFYTSRTEARKAKFRAQQRLLPRAITHRNAGAGNVQAMCRKVGLTVRLFKALESH